MTDDALDRIAEKLRRAREMDAQPFGVESHGMRLHPPIALDELAAIEARLGVALPEEYRGFIIRIGDGGAGPAYGMFTLDKALRETGVDRVPELLATPFCHVDCYNPYEDPVWNAFWDRVDEGGVGDEERRIFGIREMEGALQLCHEGCGYMHFLVVSGPQRGRMWMDGRCSDYGFSPFNVTFLEWYERWIDDVLHGGRGTWWFGPPVRPSG